MGCNGPNPSLKTQQQSTTATRAQLIEIRLALNKALRIIEDVLDDAPPARTTQQESVVAGILSTIKDAPVAQEAKEGNQ